MATTTSAASTPVTVARTAPRGTVRQRITPHLLPLFTVLAIVYLVFVSSLAGADYSVRRNLKISAVLIGLAAGFHYLLGLSLPLL